MKFFLLSRISPVFTLLLLFQVPLWSAIEVAPLFSDHMVLQRNMPVPVWGKAKPSEEITVSIGSRKAKTATDINGHWKIHLAELKAGGPHELKIETKDEKIIIRDVMVGEVWLCSGQSNMEFPMKKSIDDAGNPAKGKNLPIRLFRMSKLHNMGGAPFTKELKEKMDSGIFFHQPFWQECNAETAADFSAVAYYFGQVLADSLQVPIGLIQNAVGGSPIQSWISKEAFLSHPQLRYFVEFEEGENWMDLANINPWLAQRAKQNMGIEYAEKETNASTGHPFAPT